MTPFSRSRANEAFVVLSESELQRVAWTLGWDSDAKDLFVQYAHFEMDMAERSASGGGPQ